MVDPQGIEVFVAIAQERSFSRAADRLGIAQSVVSKRLRRLEDVFHGPLINRSVKTSISLTRIGELFLPKALEALDFFDRIDRSASNLGRGLSGPLRLGFVFSAAMNGTLTRALTALRQFAPEIKVEARLLETPEQLSELEHGRLDLGFLRPRPSYPTGCSSQIVHSEQLIVGVSAGSDLAVKPGIAPADLAGREFYVPQFHERVGLIDLIRQLSAAGKFAMPPIVRTGDFVTAVCLASAGNGVVVAPASLANLKLDGLSYREIDGFPAHIATALVSHQEAPDHAMNVLRAAFT